VKQINSGIQQAREYFSSAERSAMSVRPLLLYYGVLSLARATVLILDPTKREENLRPSHGLEIVGWQTTLAAGLASIGDVQVRVTDGTFSELVRATQNSAWMRNNVAPYPNFALRMRAYPFEDMLRDRPSFTLDELLAREPSLLVAYRQATQRPSEVSLGQLFVLGEAHCDASVMHSEGVTPERVRALFELSANDNVGFREQAVILAFPNLWTRLPAIGLYDRLPVCEPYSDGYEAIVSNIQGTYKLARQCRLFVTAYFLGMLARYYPSKWMALLRNERGDAFQPLLTQAMQTIESRFPESVVDLLA
jgi:hypothetical protein